MKERKTTGTGQVEPPCDASEDDTIQSWLENPDDPDAAAAFEGWFGSGGEDTELAQQPASQGISDETLDALLGINESEQEWVGLVDVIDEADALSKQPLYTPAVVAAYFTGKPQIGSSDAEALTTRRGRGMRVEALAHHLCASKQLLIAPYFRNFPYVAQNQNQPLSEHEADLKLQQIMLDILWLAEQRREAGVDSLAVNDGERGYALMVDGTLSLGGIIEYAGAKNTARRGAEQLSMSYAEQVCSLVLQEQRTADQKQQLRNQLPSIIEDTGRWKSGKLGGIADLELLAQHWYILQLAGADLNFADRLERWRTGDKLPTDPDQARHMQRRSTDILNDTLAFYEEHGCTFPPLE